MMGRLTKDDINLILGKLSREVVVKPTGDFPFEITVQSSGYSDDPVIGRLQAKLSIMLEVATS